MQNMEEMEIEQTVKKIPTEQTIQKIQTMETEISPKPEAETDEPECKPIPFRLLTVQEMAAIVNCSVGSLYTMKAYGRVPAPLKIGRLVRWDPRVVQKWLDDGCPSFGKKVVVKMKKGKQ